MGEFARRVHVGLVDDVFHRQRRQIGEIVGGIPSVRFDDDRRVRIDAADSLRNTVLQRQIVDHDLSDRL